VSGAPDPSDPVRVVQRCHAPPEPVFHAFADPVRLARWYWPPRFATRAEADLRPGGSYRLRSTGLPEGQNMGVGGRFIEVDPPSLLAMTWRWDGEEAESRVSISIRDIGGGVSEVTVVHDGLASADERADHADGWRSCLDRLPAYLAEPTG
jgi:uncharacterized protein YndB with AHSA1/START domain